MGYSLDIKIDELNPGRIYLGTVEVDMGKMFLFGSKRRLHEMVSFIPGMGNGAYEIYGEVKEVPGYGYRIVKVEIECITDAEILHLAKQQAEHTLEVALY